MSASASVRSATIQRRVRADTAGWVEPVGRVGLVTQGVLYAIVGLLALQVAAGHADDRADQHGAIESVAGQPFGRALLFVLTAGLAFHCGWRFLLAARGEPGDDDAKAWVKRLGHAGRGVLYASFTVAAVKVLVDAGSSATAAGGDQRAAAAQTLDWPGGQAILLLVGIAVISAGLWHASKSVTRSFADDLDLSGRSPRTRGAITLLGSVGYLARGAVFALVGWFLVQAAVNHDPNETGGLDNALKRLAGNDYGPELLRVMAVGLFVFGVFRVIDGCVRRSDALANA